MIQRSTTDLMWETCRVLAQMGHNNYRILINKSHQYYKWLSYIPDFLNEQILKISNKEIKDITEEEFEILMQFKEEQAVLKELEIYFFSDEWYKCNRKKIEEYISSHPLKEIKKRKLTKEEIAEANAKINYLHKNPSELREFMRASESAIFIVETKEYQDFSMIDAYVAEYLEYIDYKAAMQGLSAEGRHISKRGISKTKLNK